MKTAKIFLTMQYICLAGMTAIPLLISSVISEEVKSSIPSLAKVLLLTFIIILLIAALIIEIAASKKASKLIKAEKEKTVKVWLQLKLASIPFYVIAFIVYVMSAQLCFPLSLITVPLSFVFCWIMIIISGVLGIKIIKSFIGKKAKISPVHFVLQVLPVADVISTLMLRKKIKA